MNRVEPIKVCRCGHRDLDHEKGKCTQGIPNTKDHENENLRGLINCSCKKLVVEIDTTQK